MNNATPLVGLDVNFFFQIANTLVLFLLLRHFLFKPVTEFMTNRTEGIKDKIEDADRKNNEAETLRKQYEAKIADINKEGEAILNDYRNKAEARREEIIKDAQLEAQRIMDRTNVEIERTKRKALEDLKEEVVDMTLLATTKFVEKELDKDNHEKLINEFIEEMRVEQWKN